ncbi:hypothetical protein BS50DRAFT_484231 [Corynespora cassiicola Philippines]|uniref:Secreted protein n=1 Tax=Corynespora cassiicola Philippines TaxID=1448308 RepID=A0A2T2P3Y2_CORCC|nr:hypothetical protein BS50DRAFT_484231 [Corynespora cassiicola Philippines]
MHSKIATFILPILAAANPLPQTGTAPDPAQITIIDSTYSGNGCPQGSVSTSTSPDKTIVTYGFDAFQTYIGPQTKPSDHSKNCQLHLNLKYPGGFQYAVVDATYHGWARLDEGVTGQFITTYFFSQDASRTSSTRMTAQGGGALANGQIYTKNDKVETTATIWSPCGGTGILNVNNRLSLTSKNPSASGELSNDDATVAFTQQLHVSWRPCTPG